VIGWKQWLAAIAVVELLFVIMLYAGFFMHGD
jgi:hypothetical protein